MDSCCPGLSATDLASAGLVRCPAHGCGELRGLIAPSPGSRSDYYRHVQVASKSGELVCAHKRLVESDGGNYSRVDFTAAARAKAVARPGSYGAALQTSAKAPATQQGGAVAAMRAARAAAAAKARSMDGIDQYQPNSGFDLSVMEQTDGAGQLLIDPELIKSRTLLMQSLPKSVEVRVALLQPLVHGECVYGATNESTATQAGANGLSYYYACMAIILLRAPGTDARDEGEMLERAARCARDPEELLEAWRRWLRETAPSADPSASLDQPELPPPSAADADLKSAQRFQYYMSHENEGKAFQAMGAVGGLKNTACPAVAAGYAALCPQRPGPSAAATCDVPGQAPFKLKAAVYDQFFSGLKTCKAPGPLYETNELMQAVAEAGAYECMRRSTTTSCAGRVHPRVVTLLASLRGLVVGKDDGSDRPLGLGECRRRLWFGCAMAQKKPELEHFYTNPLPADAAARASELRAAEQQAGQAAAAQTAAARGQQSELFDRTTQDVVAADARLAAARAPVNFPVNFAYSRSGCELLNHTLDAWMESEPLEHQLSDDKTNMYNETVSEASFNGLREHDPDLVPLYRLFYGAPAPIYFCREKGPLRVAHLHDGDSCDEVVQALTRREAIPLGTDLRDADLWMNCTGGHQGCPGATHFACLPYHLSLHATQKNFPALKIACDADDTYLGARAEVLYPGYAALRADTLASCGTRSKLAKVVAYTRDGSHSDIPPDVPGSAYYVPAGASQAQVEAAAAGGAPRARGFKVVGAFKGDADWCGAQLGTRLQRRLAPLDRVDILTDRVDCEHTSTHRRLVIKGVAAQIPAYWAKAMSPAVARQELNAANARVRRSWELLGGAEVSPPERRDMAWGEATLSTACGGSGLTNWAMHAGAARCASIYGGWRKLQTTCPILAAQDIAAPTLPFLLECNQEYGVLRAERDRVAALYDSYDNTIHHTMRGGKIARFHLKSLPPTSAVPALDAMFHSEKDKIPAQRTLSNIVFNAAHLRCLETAMQVDAATLATDTRVPFREMSRFISISQSHSGDWCDLRTDGTHSTTPLSGQTRVAIARRHGLFLIDSYDTIMAARAAGHADLLKYDLLGDHLCNTDDCNSRHHEFCRAWHAAISAVSLHTVLLGDKDKATKSTSPLVSYNSTHVTDIVEPGGGPGGSDRLFEAKVVSPCTLAEKQGAELRGQKPSKRGYLFGFGSTEESYRIMIYGSAERGLHTDGPFDEDTGQGFVPPRQGHYSDALARGKKVIALIAEVFGGLSPHPARFLRQLSRVAAKHATRDSTKYTRCARTFRQYHGQRISHAIVMTDALNIHDGTLKLKKDFLQRRAA